MNPQEAIDNPYWPNGSAVERAKDAAAHLDYPQVNGHEWMLTEHDVECLTAGAGILASGGGGNPRLGCERAVNVLKKGKQIKLVNPCRFVSYSNIGPSLFTKDTAFLWCSTCNKQTKQPKINMYTQCFKLNLKPGLQGQIQGIFSRGRGGGRVRKEGSNHLNRAICITIFCSETRGPDPLDPPPPPPPPPTAKSAPGPCDPEAGIKYLLEHRPAWRRQ